MLYDKLIAIPGLFIAIIFHELAHGYTAYKLGDPTAKQAGRLTLNPIAHMDPIGFLSMLIFRFGWAKPVPINPMYFKRRKLDTILVSIAGPISNFIMAIISGFIVSSGIIRNSIILEILVITLWYNIMLGVFNLLPFPPLDGSKILASLLPTRYEYMFYKYEKPLHLILIILIISNTIDKMLSPLINMSLNLILKIIG
ncbi:site-2 protease family protein [Anaerosalibacter sp. Marseille-P3206]|uniref:site-2 protease family protein n=1 Tax=Anaerosalibacter sp. Marseille-P3206 TaxID=1871005 RepID=UPI00190EC97B|nr:site-2 protease family protein [Anaerosalibacter sp. Marseille-P3206]